MANTIKHPLPEEQIPKSWYNLVADLPSPPPPPLHPWTLQPIGEELAISLAGYLRSQHSQTAQSTIPTIDKGH